MKLYHERTLFVWLGLIGFILIGFIYTSNIYQTKKLLLQDTEEQLVHVANAATCKLGGKTFNDLLSATNINYYPQNYQIEYLGKTLQPLAESLSINGVGVAYFDAERNSVLAYAPSNSLEDSVPGPLPADHSSLSVLETKRPSFQLINSRWRGPVYLYTAPLIKNGHVFGLLGISIPEEYIQAKFKQNTFTSLYVSSAILAVWIVALLVIYYIRKLNYQRYLLKNWNEFLHLAENKNFQVMTETSEVPPLIDSFLEYTQICRQVVKRILDNSSLGVLIINSKFEALYVNPKLQNLLGYTLDELNELPMYERIMLFEPPAGQQRITSLLYAAPDKELHAEYMLHTQQQERIPVELRAFNLYSNNSVEAIVISVSDLRENDHFQRLESQTTLLLESMTEGVILLHEDGTITHMNRAFEDMLSASRTNWIGKNIFQSEMDESLRENLQVVLTGRISRIHALPTEFFNRQISHFSIDILALENPRSKERGALLIGKDITTEWQWSELSKRADLIHSLSQMAASMAHEVRNPLTSIKGFLQLLSQNQPSADKLSMYVQVMMEELERAHSIITEYLNLSRTNLAQQVESSLLRLLDDIRILMESEAMIRGVNLHFYLTDVTIQCDPKKIKQVMINLIRNALEATPRGGSVTVSMKPVTDKGIVEIQVTDTGSGIPAEALPYIFTPFYSTKKAGTGLGLSVCKQIIEEHHGHIQAVSKEEEEGSCFTVELPLSHTMGLNEPAPLPRPDASA